MMKRRGRSRRRRWWWWWWWWHRNSETPFIHISSFSDLTSSIHTCFLTWTSRNRLRSVHEYSTGLNKTGNARNTATRWRNICTSQAIITALYHFTRTVGFDGDFMSPATIKCALVLMYSARYFCPILTKRWSLRQTFIQIFQYRISRKSVRWERHWYRRTDRLTWRC